MIEILSFGTKPHSGKGCKFRDFFSKVSDKCQVIYQNRAIADFN